MHAFPDTPQEYLEVRLAAGGGSVDERPRRFVVRDHMPGIGMYSMISMDPSGIMK
jgi:hypothetical protein